MRCYRPILQHVVVSCINSSFHVSPNTIEIKSNLKYCMLTFSRCISSLSQSLFFLYKIALQNLCYFQQCLRLLRLARHSCVFKMYRHLTVQRGVYTVLFAGLCLWLLCFRVVFYSVCSTIHYGVFFWFELHTLWLLCSLYNFWFR